jgi:hypothetical protein
MSTERWKRVRRKANEKDRIERENGEGRKCRNSSSRSRCREKKKKVLKPGGLELQLRFLN